MQASPDQPIPQEQVDRIGNLLLAAAPQPRGRILLIAELDDGYMGSRLLWHAPDAPSLVQLDPPLELYLRLSDTVIDAWEDSARRTGRTAWTLMTFLVEDGRFSVRVGQLPGSGDDAFARFAEAEIARVFPGLPVAPAQVPTRPPPPTREAGEAVPTPADLDRIRGGLIAAAGTADAKIVLFARFEENMSASAIRYRVNGRAGVQPADFATETDPDLTEIWNAAHERMGNNVWRELIVVVEQGVARMTLRQPSNPDFHAGFSQAATEVERTEFPD